MCSRLRGHIPVYPNCNHSKVLLQLALISYGPRDACCHCLLVLLEGRIWTSSLTQDFPLFLQTWSLYQLASILGNTVPGGRYGDPFPFITSRDLSVVLLLIFFKLRSFPASGSYHKCPAGRHSPGLCPDFNTRLPPPHLSLTWNPFLQKLFIVWASAPQSMCGGQQDTCEGRFYHVASNSGHDVWQ